MFHLQIRPENVDPRDRFISLHVGYILSWSCNISKKRLHYAMHSHSPILGLRIDIFCRHCLGMLDLQLMIAVLISKVCCRLCFVLFEVHLKEMSSFIKAYSVLINFFGHYNLNAFERRNLACAAVALDAFDKLSFCIVLADLANFIPLNVNECVTFNKTLFTI